MTPGRILKAAVGAAVSLLIFSGCDQGTSAGHNWVVTPDVALHRSTGYPLITATGQCGNGTTTWIARSAEADADMMTQGQTLVASCYPGYPIGTWGLEERPK